MVQYRTPYILTLEKTEETEKMTARKNMARKQYKKTTSNDK